MEHRDQEHIGQRTFQRDREVDEGYLNEDYRQGRDHDATESFRGRGPKGYRRSDDRIKEEVSDCLSNDNDLDASEIEVSVQDGEVTLSGTVDSRRTKRLAEDLACEVSGVSDVSNQIKIRREDRSAHQNPRH